MTASWANRQLKLKLQFEIESRAALIALRAANYELFHFHADSVSVADVITRPAYVRGVGRIAFVCRAKTRNVLRTSDPNAKRSCITLLNCRDVQADVEI